MELRELELELEHPPQLWRNSQVSSSLTTTVNDTGAVPGVTAPEIVDAVLKVFTSRGISLEKLCGVATNGANVMVGCRTGVTTLLKDKNPFILSIHCIAHRLALASGQAADAVPYVKQYQLYINNIYRYIHYSTKNAKKLKEIQLVMQSAERKFHPAFRTRWLSFEGAVDAIVASIDPLFTVLIEDSTSDPTVKGILKFVATYSFLATTYLLADILPILARLSKRFQRSQVDFTTVTDGVSVTTATLSALKTTPGPSLPNSLVKSLHLHQHLSLSTTRDIAFLTAKRSVTTLLKIKAISLIK